jgi:hypothetical protein
MGKDTGILPVPLMGIDPVTCLDLTNLTVMDNLYEYCSFMPFGCGSPEFYFYGCHVYCFFMNEFVADPAFTLFAVEGFVFRLNYKL